MGACEGISRNEFEQAGSSLISLEDFFLILKKKNYAVF